MTYEPNHNIPFQVLLLVFCNLLQQNSLKEVWDILSPLSFLFLMRKENEAFDSIKTQILLLSKSPRTSILPNLADMSLSNLYPTSQKITPLSWKLLHLALDIPCSQFWSDFIGSHSQSLLFHPPHLLNFLILNCWRLSFFHTSSHHLGSPI